MSEWQPISSAPKDRRILIRTENEIYAATWSKNFETDDQAWCVGRMQDDMQFLILFEAAKGWMECPMQPIDEVKK